MKKKNFIMYLCCLLLCSCTEKCNEEHVDVTICNNSAEKIYYAVEFGRNIPKGDSLKSSSFRYKDYFVSLDAGQKDAIDFQKRYLYDGLQMLIIKSSTMDMYDNKSFYEADDVCDKRFILSYNELEKMGFTIQYEDDF
jgi:hypothetical protein